MARYIESWKPIDGYEGLYDVSDNGQIRNSRGVILSLTTKKDNHTNYKEVSLWKNGEHKRFLVHRLVAKAFISNPDNLPIINHKDCDGTNNNVENLEWCNHSYNNRYNRFPEKTISPKTDKRLSEKVKAKISESVKEFRRKNTKLKFEYKGTMLSIPELAEKMNIRQGTLRARYKRTGSVFLGSARMDGDEE